MEALTPAHLALIMLGFVVLFGYTKLPDAARALGRSMRIFRSEMKALGEDEAQPGQDAASPGRTSPVS